MPRYLIQLSPQALQEISRGPLVIPQLSLVIPQMKPVFDYAIANVPVEVAAQLAGQPGIIKVVPDRLVRLFQRPPIPIDQEIQSLWTNIRNPFAFPRILQLGIARPNVWPTSLSRAVVGADVADADGISGEGVKVAVLDTGVDLTHPQLLGQRGESTVDGQPLELDENGHGTHVSSTVAGSSFPHPYGDLQGVAPGAQLIIIKVLGYLLGMGTMSGILRGMAKAAELGAKILSMSLGGEDTNDPDDPEFRAVRLLTEQGILCVVAAGNSGPNSRTIGNPGSAPDSLTVAALNKDLTVADFSSRGPTFLGLDKPDVAAPGVNILSGSTGLIALYRAIDGVRFSAISGTSMATPHASGVIALAEEYARAQGKTLTTPVAKAAMELYGQPKDTNRGWGLITYQLLKRYIDENGANLASVESALARV